MANLMLTTFCNFTCEYCFGLDMIGPGKQAQHMSQETFLALLDWIDADSPPQMEIHLMGGEPTLSPYFQEFLRELSRRKRGVLIFSNASSNVSKDAVRESCDLGMRWVVNCNPPEKYKGNQLDNLKRNLALLGNSATLTFNITRGDMPYQFILDYIEQFQLNRVVKVGIALPTMEHNNVFVPIEVFGEVAPRVVQFAEDAYKAGIAVEFECGVPACLFSESQREKLGDVVISHCGSRLDITPDGRVINCLPLAKMADIPYNTFPSYQAALGWFIKALEPYRGVGAGVACHDCESRLRGMCMACLAYGISQYNRIVLPEIPRRQQSACSGNQPSPSEGGNLA